jgi:protein transport protein SEC31
MAWNPEEATQIITASEDDGTPVIEIWDLRYTYAPTKVIFIFYAFQY